MKAVDLALAAAVSLATVAAWSLGGRAVEAPPWPELVSGYAFSPARRGDDPGKGRYPEAATIAEDVALLAPRTRALRTYALEGPLAEVPALAARAGMSVLPGVWIDGGAGDDERLARLAALAAREPAIGEVVVGNETLLREVLELDELVSLLARTRALVDVPISTAEPWHVWLAEPELAHHVDFLTVHILPYWEGIAAAGAVDFVAARMAELRAAFPGRRIVIGEVGWPTRGRPRGEARASRADAARFLRHFLARAEAAGWEYFLMEAFDQPWKRDAEGDVGAYWGIHDLDRRPKLAERGPIRAEPRWPVAAAASACLALAVLAALLRDAGRLTWRGRAFLGGAAAVAGSALAAVLLSLWTQYWTMTGALSAVLLVGGAILAIAVALVEVHEWAEALWSGPRRRLPARSAGAALRLPPVTLHVPIHDEPPALVKETLDALAALDYPELEVVVVDNNTADERRWQPVASHCEALGSRFRFFHVAPLAGFKAGALNFALARSHPDAELVAVVDCDYRVEARWLRELAGAFADPALAVVQAPQDYRDGGRGAFKAACYAEYRGFFSIGMVTRNERNAIIQHGTMTLVRREALEQAGGWAEWTVTEDAELGLRLMQQGWETLYVPRSYGRGLTPDSFPDYRRQRARWALGAMQILRGHRAALLGAGGGLDAGQRYHFVAGWLPWIADGLNVLFALAALGWSVAMVLAPSAVDAPAAAFAAIPVALFALRLAKVSHLYRRCVGATWRDTGRAALAGLALAPAAGLAAISGLLGRRAAFARTPKLGRRDGIAATAAAVAPEALVGLGLLGCALAIGAAPVGGPDVELWRVALVTLAAPYLAATALAARGAGG